MLLKLVIRRSTDPLDRAPRDARTFDEPLISIGSDPASTLLLEDEAVAPEHVVILNEHDQLMLINRAPGTLLNNETLVREAQRPLFHGDILFIGGFTLDIVLQTTQDSTNGSNRAAATTSMSVATSSTTDDSAVGGANRAPVNASALAGSSPSVDASTSIISSSTQKASPSQSALPPAANDPRLTPASAESRRDSQPESGATPQNQTGERKNSFASILDSLRTEEDSFYFSIETGERMAGRIRVEAAEMLLGWDATGEGITSELLKVSAPRAVVRKDWSGVVIHAHGGKGTVQVNGTEIEEAQRLRNGDRVTFTPANPRTANATVLIFHEPASLVVLDSMLPQKLPPVRSASHGSLAVANAAVTTNEQSTRNENAAAKAKGKRTGVARKYFGYFTGLEVIVMILGTLIAATIIFLIFEYA